MDIQGPEYDEELGEWIVLIDGLPIGFTDEVYAQEFLNQQMVFLGDEAEDNG